MTINEQVVVGEGEEDAHKSQLSSSSLARNPTLYRWRFCCTMEGVHQVGGWGRGYSYPADVCQRASQGPPWLSVTGSLTSGPGPPGSRPPAAVWKQKQSAFHWLQQWVTHQQKFQLSPLAPPPPPLSICNCLQTKSQLFTDYNGQPHNGKSSNCPPFPLQQSRKQKQCQLFVDYNSQPHNGQRPPFLSHCKFGKQKQSFTDYNSQPHNGQRPPFLSHCKCGKQK